MNIIPKPIHKMTKGIEPNLSILKLLNDRMKNINTKMSNLKMSVCFRLFLICLWLKGRKPSFDSSAGLLHECTSCQNARTKRSSIIDGSVSAARQLHLCIDPKSAAYNRFTSSTENISSRKVPLSGTPSARFSSAWTSSG